MDCDRNQGRSGKQSPPAAHNKFNVAAMTRVALMSAVMAVSAQMAVPISAGAPLTLQTFAAALCGYILGTKSGLAAVGAYLLLGAAGMPVFASFTGGVMKLAGATGGFLWGFLPLAALCGTGRNRSTFFSILLGLTGLIVCHALGVMQFALLTEKGVWASACMVSLPFLPKDVLSVVGGWAFARLLNRRIMRGKKAGKL